MIRKKKNKTIGQTTTDIIINEEMLIARRKKIPIIGDLSIESQFFLMKVLIAISTTAVLGSGAMLIKAKNKEVSVVKDINKLENNSVTLNSEIINILNGEKNDISRIISITNDNSNKVTAIYHAVGQRNNEASQQLNEIIIKYNEINKIISYIAENQSYILNKNDTLNNINTEIEKIAVWVTEQIEVSDSGSERQRLLAVYGHLKSISGNLSALNGTNKINSNELFSQIWEELRAIDAHLINLGHLPLVEVARVNLRAVSVGVSTVYQMYGGKVNVQQLSENINELSSLLSDDLTALSDIYIQKNISGSLISAILSLLSFIVLMLVGYLSIYTYKVNSFNSSLFDKMLANQSEQSVMQLLSEMTPLQYGDLTQKATVTQEITGAVADLINATIDSLASLVKKIKDKSLIVDNQAELVNESASRMLEIANEQTKSLDGVKNTVEDITRSILDIADKTDQSSKKAFASVALTKEVTEQVKGSLAVMKDMDKSMLQIVRLMSKVDYSSRQISEIIDLLSDITERTSVLAINATVQASKSDEQNQGFKIVADSIKDLASEAVSASKRVSDLIRAVQADTSDVGEAVKETTNSVKKGVELSESASTSLDKIIESTEELSERVAAVSKDAKMYSLGTSKVNASMDELLRVTMENKEISAKTVQSIQDILKASKDLSDSVQSFKL